MACNDSDVHMDLEVHWKIEEPGTKGGRSQLPASSLSVDLLGNATRVFKLNNELPDGAVQLCMSKQKLHRAQIAGFAVG